MDIVIEYTMDVFSATRKANIVYCDSDYKAFKYIHNICKDLNCVELMDKGIFEDTFNVYSKQWQLRKYILIIPVPYYKFVILKHGSEPIDKDVFMAHLKEVMNETF